MVFLRVQKKGSVSVSTAYLGSDEQLLHSVIASYAADHVGGKKASKKHGYYVALTAVDHVGEGQLDDFSGLLVFPVSYTCITMAPFEGEILTGTVVHVMERGLFLKSGPVENAFLAAAMMEDYRYYKNEGEELYLHARLPLKMESGSKVRYRVLGVEWVQEQGKTEAHVHATIVGDYLGPVW